ncbi:hypothetical protein SLS62_006421 [Diatrype stigma]|uniref:GH64 domain-containing protein n=1 Tax=Diatrype stigma TaxID=117547 RepID=A0AAN9YP26_9PEZI
MTAPTTNFALVNNTGTSDAFAYVTGLEIDNNNAPVFIQSDGKTVYRPTSPSAPQSPLAADVAIPLGAPGSTTTVTIPHLAGGRIWFSIGDGSGKKLTFTLNPGPAVVEPSVTNKDDPNWALHWGFAEFTYNDAQLFVNISYVDFVALPIALRLRNAAGKEQVVEGIPDGGLAAVAQQLEAQHAADGAGWDQLVVRDAAGTLLRALSPNSGRVADAGLFADYYAPYVDAVWAKYAGEDLKINTQFDWGVLSGRVTSDGALLTFEGQGSFAKPSAGDIFSCSTGPFGGYPKDKADVLGNLGARIAAALNRSTLLANASQPDGERVADYYKEAVTNHYARILHAVNSDGRGYAFPYDDVVASGDDQPDQAGTVFDGAPELLTVTLGSLQAAGTGGGDSESGGGDKKKEEGGDGDATTPDKKTGFWKGALGFLNKATGGCFGRS